MLHVTTLRRRSSLRTVAVAAALALLLGLGTAGSAVAARPGDRSAESGWSQPWEGLGALIARLLGLEPGAASGRSSGGPHMDPNGLSSQGDDGPDMGPNGLGTDGDDGPHMDPNGLGTDDGPHMDPNG